MNAAEEIIILITDLQRIQIRLSKLNNKAHLDRFFRGTYDDIGDHIHEASSNLADFWIALSERNVEDI